MGSRLGIRTEQFIPAENHTWLKVATGTQDCDSVTLDGDTFLTLFTTGIVPSGVVISKRVSDGLYVPYVGTAEKQRVVIDATAGNFTLGLDGQTTANQAFNVSAANLQLALEALPNLNPGDVAVTGGPGNAGGTTPYFVEFIGGQYAAGDNPPQIVATGVGLSGGAATATATTPTTSPTDGSQTAKGHLFTTTDLGGTVAANVGNVPVPLLWRGAVIEAKLPANHGLDSRAKTDLKQIQYF